MSSCDLDHVTSTHRFAPGCIIQLSEGTTPSPHSAFKLTRFQRRLLRNICSRRQGRQYNGATQVTAAFNLNCVMTRRVMMFVVHGAAKYYAIEMV